MLSPLDDFPYHQVPEPIRRVGTSDRNFYDRYYFNCHPSSGDLFLIIGLGQYPNLSTSDAFALLRRGDEHRVVRASKELGADRSDLGVGPFRIEVLEGLRRLRVVLEPNEHGLSFDLIWEGAIPATEEPRHTVRMNDRIIIDAARLAQTGRWTGHIAIDGARTEVTPDRWWGSRDRSWGIRPVGEFEPSGVGAHREPGSFYWVYAPVQLADSSILVIVQENAEGRRIVEEALRVWPEGSGRGPEFLGRPEIRLDFAPGTRDVRGGSIRFARGDDKLPEIQVEVVVPAHLGVGTGYGFDADWRHGMYQGKLAVSGVTLDLAPDSPDRAKLFGIVDNLARFRTSDGETGWGLFEVMVMGPHRPSGFQSWTDGAPAEPAPA